ncbi:hypothetical protein R1T16_14170 [Flavobacterium sp. DG1-102-2]|nr:hypothetical protein [Flavobacterium sp. DG1-102-2]MDV6169578.1 hypothetical protein [Flavobacterium sp. DG1-102-2]
MKTTSLHIEKPNEGLLKLVREIKADKDAAQKELKSQWDTYFPKEK